MTPSVRLISATLPVEDKDYVGPYGEGSLGLETGLDLIEFAGRWDYGERSIAKLGTDPGIIGRWLASGEESMIEMVDVTFLITCSRVVSHELVRHRLASFQQESQRFVSYENETADSLFFVPEEIGKADTGTLELQANYGALVRFALETYLRFRSAGVSKQIARYVLPNATRTRIVMKANLREWRLILRQRFHTSVQPETREVAGLILAKLQRGYGKELFPDNIAEKRAAR